MGRPRLHQILVSEPKLTATVNQIETVAESIRSGTDIFGMPPEVALDMVAANLRGTLAEKEARQAAKEKQRKARQRLLQAA